MNNETQKKLNCLRFTEFKQDLEEVGFSDLGEIKIGLTHTPKYIESGIIFLSSKNISKGFIDFEDVKYISEDEFLNITDSAKPKVGDILFTRVGSNLGNPIILEVDKDLAIFVSLGIFRVNKKAFNYYIKYWMESDVFWKQVEQKVAGGAKMNLNTTWLKEFKLYIPSYQEQQKIANCLSSLDNLITAETEKLDHLKDHKKGLLQQLFPAKGETKPQFRFPEFENDGNWEIKEVGEIFEVTRGYVLSMSLLSETQTKENNYPVYSSQTKNNGLAGYYKESLYENAITWTTDGANAGDVNYREGKFYCTNVCGVLINENGMANKCIAALINSVSKSHVSYIGNPKLMNGVMSKIKIPIPSVKEQIKISEVITSIDDLIESQKVKIKALKKHKKGLMQQLFPNSL